jgi:ketosteroid isomerase-like protein
MSQENVEAVRRSIEAFNRRDLAALLAFADTEVVVAPRITAMEGGDFNRGHDGVRRWYESLLDVFPDFKLEADEIRSEGDRTIAALRGVGHGVGSDTPIDDRFWQVAEWREGKCVWWRTYGSEADALEAVGLRE